MAAPRHHRYAQGVRWTYCADPVGNERGSRLGTAAAPDRYQSALGSSTACVSLYSGGFVGLNQDDLNHPRRAAVVQLPNDFKVTDNTLASLASCVLDLGAEDLVDGPYVKRLRQRERDGAK